MRCGSISTQEPIDRGSSSTSATGPAGVEEIVMGLWIE